MTTIKAFDCEMCGLGPSVGVTTFRVNAKGQKRDIPLRGASGQGR